MLIKRVAIQGFKTFARRTEFLFDPGITAIVGPNGSGKSNIVDAVRWCLGEQTFSLLRSKKTSDVIFSGSDKRARLGMAEVRLLLDNSQGEMPIDFAEVEITRRAYRDGDNDYLINGQRVRLADVTELLSHTGLGKRSYAVIGQGLIDQVLSYSPEERRVLFEEAAGITGYQAKRSSTLRRLEATQQNLTRAQDILTELSPRLKYLRRQAERAREYTDVAAELRDLLSEWYGYRWHTTLAALEEHRINEAETRNQVERRQAALSRLSQQIEQVRAQQGELRTTLGDLHKASSELHHQVELVDRELAVNNERLHHLQTRSEESQRELAALQAEQAAMVQRITSTEETVAAARLAHRQQEEAVTALQAAVTARQQEQARLQNAVEQARRTLHDLQRRRVECVSRLAQLAERQTTLEQEQHTQQTEATAAEANSQTLGQQLAATETALADLETTHQTTQQELQRLEQVATNAQTALHRGEEERQQADRALDRLQTRFDLLQRLREEGAGYASGVRAVLQASRQNRAGPPLSGILGTVASLLTVPAQLDKAIEVALGGAFQDVITERWEDARQAIEYLKTGKHGRATFLPLDRLYGGDPISAPRRAGLLGNAYELIEYEPQIVAAAQQLLGRVWVAEDLPSGRQALDQYSGRARPTVVTLLGEIIRPGGAVTGGSDHNRRDDSILARERELRALPAQIEAARRTLQAAVAHCQQLAQARDQAQAQIDETKASLADLTRRERSQRQQHEEVRRQWDRAQQTLRWQSERVAQIQQELSQQADQVAKLNQQREQLQAEESAAASALTEREAALQAAGAAPLLQELADLRAAAAEAHGHLRNQQTLLDNQKRSAQSLGDQARAKDQQRLTFQQEGEAVRQNLAQLTTREQHLRTELETLRQQIEPLAAQATRAAAQQTEQEQLERDAQHAMRRDEANWNAAQLQLQRSQDQLQQLRHEIEQDLGLVTLEQSEEVAYQPPLPLEKYVEQLPVVEAIAPTLEEEVRDTRMRLARASNVNPDAPREYEEAAERYDFLLTQSADLEAAAADLNKVLKELDLLMEVAFERTYKAVAEKFEGLFQQLFNGGTAELTLTAPNDLASTGIEIIARPPNKRPQSLALLSGGERALAACALIFAILQVSPTPFCVLDEVDAALDEANVDRFRQTVETLSQGTQFIIVTHNRRTLEGANTIYGVTMGNDGVSTVISLRLEADQIVVQGDERGGNGTKQQLQEIEEVVAL